MCSGCSDYYEGEDDDQDGEEPFSAQREGQEDRRVPGPEGKCPDGDAEGHGAGRKTGSQAAGRGAGEWEDYEVLVSAYCIIERRRIPANCCAINAQQAAEETALWRESQPGRKHLRGCSANSYRTHGKFESKLLIGSDAACMCLMLCGLAGAMVMGLVIWMAAG